MPTCSNPAAVAWGSFLAYLAAIYLSTPWIRTLNNLLVRHIGARIILWLALILSGLTLAGIGLWLALKRPSHLISRWLGLAGVALGSAGFVIYTQAVPVETIHLIEYGLLAWPALLVARTKSEGLRAYLLAWILVALGGTGDEALQLLLPDRVGDVRDILLNAGAGGLGLGLLGWVLRLKPGQGPVKS